MALFGEGPSRVVVSAALQDLPRLTEILEDLPHWQIGRVTGDTLRCTMRGKELLAVSVEELHAAYESLPDRLS